MGRCAMERVDIAVVWIWGVIQGVVNWPLLCSLLCVHVQREHSWHCNKSASVSVSWLVLDPNRLYSRICLNRPRRNSFCPVCKELILNYLLSPDFTRLNLLAAPKHNHLDLVVVGPLVARLRVVPCCGKHYKTLRGVPAMPGCCTPNKIWQQ